MWHSTKGGKKGGEREEEKQEVNGNGSGMGLPLNRDSGSGRGEEEGAGWSKRLGGSSHRHSPRARVCVLLWVGGNCARSDCGGSKSTELLK